jgi:hypothetical protein
MWPIVAPFGVDVQAWGWPSTIWLAAQAVTFGACGWPSEIVEITATEVGACGWPSEIVETTAAEVGACGCPSEIVDTCLLCLVAVLMFKTAIPNEACEGEHPGGGFADGAMAEVTPPGKAKGEAWAATTRARTAREYLILILRVWDAGVPELLYKRHTGCSTDKREFREQTKNERLSSAGIWVELGKVKTRAW